MESYHKTNLRSNVQDKSEKYHRPSKKSQSHPNYRTMRYIIRRTLAGLCFVRNTIVDHSDGQKMLNVNRTMEWIYPISCSKSTTYSCHSISAIKNLLAGKRAQWLNCWGAQASQHGHTTKTFWLQSYSLCHRGRQSPFPKARRAGVSQTNLMLCGAVRPETGCGCPRDHPGTRRGLVNNMTFALNNFHRNSATVGTKCLHVSFGAKILYASRYNED